jgi:hypothetical protein
MKHVGWAWCALLCAAVCTCEWLSCLYLCNKSAQSCEKLQFMCALICRAIFTNHLGHLHAIFMRNFRDCECRHALVPGSHLFLLLLQLPGRVLLNRVEALHCPLFCLNLSVILPDVLLACRQLYMYVCMRELYEYEWPKRTTARALLPWTSALVCGVASLRALSSADHSLRLNAVSC